MDKNPVLMSRLSMESDIPLYSQLVNIIKRNITAGTLNPGDQLPSESELCKNFDISRSTVRQAVSMLEDEGLVVRKQGRGTYVAEPKVRRKTEKLYSFTSEMSSMGLLSDEKKSAYLEKYSSNYEATLYLTNLFFDRTKENSSEYLTALLIAATISVASRGH